MVTDESGLGQRNALNLDVDILGQCLDGHTAAGRLVYKPLGILLIHGLVLLLAHDMSLGITISRVLGLTTKLSISARKMLTLTTFSMLEPAAMRTALRFLMHCPVFS